VLSVPEPV